MYLDNYLQSKYAEDIGNQYSCEREKSVCVFCWDIDKGNTNWMMIGWREYIVTTTRWEQSMFYLATGLVGFMLICITIIGFDKSK